MNRDGVIAYIMENYSAEPEYPWIRTPRYAVFRHKPGRKWFAVMVDVSKDKLGLDGNEVVDALLLKCDPLMIGSLLDGRDILPGYHMNKEHWITIVLGGAVPAEQVHSLIELSYFLTK